MEVWASAFLGMSIGILVYALFRPRENLLKEKLSSLTLAQVGYQTLSEAETDFVSRVVKPLLSSITRSIGRRFQRLSVADIDKRLTLAGNPMSLNVDQFIALKIVTAILGVGSFVMLSALVEGVSVSSLLWALMGGGIGWIIPDFWLSRLIKQRQKRISSELPGILDILVVTTEAGLTFDSALQRICDHTEGVLASEFAKVIEDIRLHRPRSQALREMAERCGVDDLSVFVTAIIQAESRGTSIAHVLRSQAKRVRDKFRQNIEEKAGKLSVWLLFPTVLFIVPALFIVVLGGAIVDMSGRFF